MLAYTMDQLVAMDAFTFDEIVGELNAHIAELEGDIEVANILADGGHGTAHVIGRNLREALRNARADALVLRTADARRNA